jgi:hypothetical protein
MKLIYSIILVVMVQGASAASIPESAIIPNHAPAMLVLHDQFDTPQTLAFPTTSITLLTIADRTGSAQLAGWIAPVKQRFGERIDIRGIADVFPRAPPAAQLGEEKISGASDLSRDDGLDGRRREGIHLCVR